MTKYIETTYLVVRVGEKRFSQPIEHIGFGTQLPIPGVVES